MRHDDASVILLTCTDDPSGLGVTRSGTAAELRAVTVPARPGRADVDPLLAGPVSRLVVAGTDADLAAVLVRLLRKDRLDVELAYVPADRRSPAARLWGLPHGVAAVDLAREGVARPAPLVRDDTGGVLVGRGEIRGAAGPVHGEVYCDGMLALRGSARRLLVTPWAAASPVPRPEPADRDPDGMGADGSAAPARPDGMAADGSAPARRDPDGAARDGSAPPARPDGMAARGSAPGDRDPDGSARDDPVPPARPDGMAADGSAPTRAAGLLEPAPPGVAVRASRWGASPDGRMQPVPPDARAGRGAAVGRAVQVGCLPATVVHDGVVHPRPVTRWAWYRHVADWLLVRP